MCGRIIRARIRKSVAVLMPAPNYLITHDFSCKCKLNFSVRGFLLGVLHPDEKKETSDTSELKSDRAIRVLDSIPAIHTNLLAPIVETLLIHLDSYCIDENLQIVGVYFANQRANDTRYPIRIVRTLFMNLQPRRSVGPCCLGQI